MRLALLVLLSAACAGEPEGEQPEDSGQSEQPELCAEAPGVVSWANFGAGFVTQHCQACHASQTPDRHGAPEQVTFDDEAQVWARADRILARVLGESPTMPPQGGVSDDDLYLLEVWLTCSEPPQSSE